MSEGVFRAIAAASSGYVEAPAGCGKTEAIVRTVGYHCSERQLVLTHTHAGVDALRQRFKEHHIPAAKFHIDTIAGWAWGWVRRYPENANYHSSIEFAVWDDVYAAMLNLLSKDFVVRGILNSYAGLIVDEYQDCTLPMHQLMGQLGTLLPCRVLGDELQGIFGLGSDQLVNWSDVRGEFKNDLGTLDTPHRWNKAGNEPLGKWLIGAREHFKRDQEPDFSGSSIVRDVVSQSSLSSKLINLTHQKNGRICVVRPKARSLPAGLETSLVKNSYRILEANDLPTLRGLIEVLVNGTDQQKSSASVKFVKRSFGGLNPGDRDFVKKVLCGNKQRPLREDRKSLASAHIAGTTPRSILAVLGYLEDLDDIRVKLSESVSALKCILEEHIETESCLRSLYADEISRRKYQRRSNVFRCVGSTLLVKGLEFDHAIIVRGENWGSLKDLYVALTRGSKSVTLLDLRESG